MLKKMLIATVRYLLQFKPLNKFVDYLYYQSHKNINRDAIKKFIKVVASSGSAKVLRGPFKGMVYPQMTSSGSELAPKIIGSYECELHGIVENACHKKYAQIIDIGAGEGYYAVGFARRIPEIEIFAFDVNGQAIELCKMMAIANQVVHRIIFKDACTMEQLAQFEFDEHKRGFILCDCEGCELDILDPKILPNLKFCDLLVEVHDFSPSGPTSFETLYSKFSSTHLICPINIKQRDPQLFPELRDFSESEKISIIAEHRKYSVGWLFMESFVEHISTENASTLRV